MLVFVDWQMVFICESLQKNNRTDKKNLVVYINVKNMKCSISVCVSLRFQ